MPQLPSGLGPWCVGVRVVVRRRLPGPSGPSGGPALTDLLGILEDWGDHTVTVRAEDGTTTVIDRSDIVAGKPVPPRASLRLRVSAADAELRAADGWPAVEELRLGDWLLRASGGFSARGNSALLVGDPGRAWEEALASVRRFYADRGLPTWVQSIDESEEQLRLVDAGWVPARPGDSRVALRVGGVAMATRTLRDPLPADPPPVTLAATADAAWLAHDERALAHLDAARAVLHGPDEVVFGAVTDVAGEVIATGRAALSTRGDVWVVLTDLWVSAGQRRRGLGSVVLRGLLGWAAERGAGTACLQVRLENGAAADLYDTLGFGTHHTYRYLTPSEAVPGRGPLRGPA